MVVRLIGRRARYALSNMRHGMVSDTLMRQIVVA